jgi:hypothetical protein
MIRSSIDDASRRLGMDRRFPARRRSGCGLTGPFDWQVHHGGTADRHNNPAWSGHLHHSPPEDLACQQALASNGEFIFDVHTPRHPQRPMGAEL